MNRIIGLTAAVTLALLVPAALAQEEGAAGTGANPSILTQVHDINLAEIQEGKLAEQNGQSKKVKDYGKELVRDHERADKDVQKEAKKLGVSLSGEQAADQTEIGKLQGLTGADFDKEFVKDEIDGHQKTITMIKDALPQTSNPGEKKLLNNLLPTLKKHLKTAQKLEKTVGASASAQ
ncbi:MAG: DUF4142 domain-containing protein [Myxococcales bacterium]